MEETGEVTRLLRAARDGDERALELAVGAVYTELQRLARLRMARERKNHTLEPTALVNEACLRLLKQDRDGWNDRRHLIACAAQQMHRVLVDYARARKSKKRGGGVICQVSKIDAAIPESLTATDLLIIEEALEELAATDPRQCRIVELRYFVGLSEDETADVLDVHVRTVRRDWAHARAVLCRHLKSKMLHAAAN